MIMSIGLTKGTEIKFVANGSDERQAVKELIKFVEHFNDVEKENSYHDSNSSSYDQETRIVKENFESDRADGVKYGDVIYVDRGIYKHYGIYIGNDRVIHYSGSSGLSSSSASSGSDASIHEAPISEFLDGSTSCKFIDFRHQEFLDSLIRSLRCSIGGGGIVSTALFAYAVANKKNIYSPEETVQRARSRIGERKYSVTSNNCEHFAMWCKTGIAESKQVKEVENAALKAGALYLVTFGVPGGSILRKFIL